MPLFSFFIFRKISRTSIILYLNIKRVNIKKYPCQILQNAMISQGGILSQQKGASPNLWIF